MLFALLASLAATAVTPEGAVLPRVQGSTLSQVEVTLPADLGAERSVVMIATQRDHQAPLDACWPGVSAAAAAAGSPTWELMLLPSGLPGVVRKLIAKGMVKATPDPARQAHKVVAGADVSAVVASLQATEEELLIAVISSTGTVSWRATAPCDEAMLTALRTVLDSEG